jgi:serine/threonine protein kinase
VKPSNILLEEGLERALLTDFGLARASDDASLTYTGHALGTPHYMSPEQARGDAVDAASDLFSLGSVIYAMCSGRPPFRAESAYGVLRRITDPSRERFAKSTRHPAWLAALIDKLLSSTRRSLRLRQRSFRAPRTMPRPSSGPPPSPVG